MIFFRFILFSLLSMLLLKATIHEDAEDQKTARWKLMSKSSFSKVKNIYDLNKKSHVIEFKGEETKYGYEFKTTKVKKNEYWLSWEMKFSEDFVLIVLVESNIGKHYLVYTPGTFHGHMQYGLGHASNNGKWQTVNRNLQEDIAYFDNRVKVVSLKSFVVKGNGRIDNIKTKTTMITQKKKLVKKKEAEKIFIEQTHTLPVITIRGPKLVNLNLGESYVEKGVSAYDKEDGDINVETMENIDINVVGRYMVLYMATDQHGNMALDKRYVDVGDSKTGEVKSTLDEEITEEDDDNHIYEVTKFSEEEKQIRMWQYELNLKEKELALREKELRKKEKKSNKN